MVEQILRDYARAYSLKSVALRYFNAAGADPEGELGEDHEPETHLIPLVLRTAAGRQPSVTVFGDDYPTRDGTCVRDYTHVADLAEAHVLALNQLEAKHDTFTAYNLGTGRGATVMEIINAAKAITGRDIGVELGSRRPGDPSALIANVEAAASGLGWRPRYSGVDTIIASAWKWMLRAGNHSVR